MPQFLKSKISRSSCGSSELTTGAGGCKNNCQLCNGFISFLQPSHTFLGIVFHCQDDQIMSCSSQTVEVRLNNQRVYIRVYNVILDSTGRRSYSHAGSCTLQKYHSFSMFGAAS